MADITDNPDFQEFARHAINDLVPQIDDSAYCVSIVPSKPESYTDIKWCIELGVMIMLDKPIIAIIAPGSKPPEHLVRVADEILELATNDASFQERLMEALGRVSKKLGMPMPDLGE